MSALRDWWKQLSRREQRTLALGALAAGLIFFYFLLWQPVREHTATLEQRLEEREALLVLLQDARLRLGAQVAADGPTRPPANQALFALADQSARQAGLQQVLRRVEPSGQGAARVQFENIAFDDLVRWLGDLRDRYGVTATNVTLRRSAIEGRVDVQLVLEPS